MAEATRAVVENWKRTAGQYRRRILSRDVVRQAFTSRVETMAARAALPPPGEREAALRAASPAYVEAASGTPASLGRRVHRLSVAGLHWWMPVVNARAEGPTEAWIRKQTFPYLAITQTRELAVGGVMLDLGANIGRMSIPRVVFGDVTAAYCAEPDPLNFACLVGNIVDNGLRGMLLPDRVAVGDRDGSVVLARSKFSGGHQVVDDGVPAGGDRAAARERIDVPSVTVDTWLERLHVDPDAVTFVKVDVQGYEARVLHGAARLLSRRHAAWQIEVDPVFLAGAGSSLAELCEQLRRHFTQFIDLKGTLSGPRERPIEEIADGLGYLGDSDRKTDVLVF